ncbi:LCP family protein [Nocardioides sp. URHA0020]|uniref:LCP family protein n=1 Tax=Nocardioides sp. URHA0020 TaxID=1380392 RepID=UPI00048F3EE2|nr:LCP family protein [Nocardioides sp. URHA0020]
MATPGGPKRRGKVRKRHTVGKVLLASIVVLALATGLSVVFLYRHLNGNLQVLDPTSQLSNRPEKAVVEGPREPLNVLVMGSDSREGAGNNIDGLTGGGERSDTTILMHLSADRKRAYGISVPRDLLVDRPDCKKKDGTTIPGATQVMWNEAFALGGPACTIQQFEQVSGIRLDHFVVVDFEGFRGMVDAIGGVEVCIPEDIDDPAHAIHISAGTRKLKGKQALNYVRERYVVGNGSDVGRMKRQQAFIASMAHQVVTAGTLARPDRLVRFLDSATKSLTVDPGLKNVVKLAKLGDQFKGIGLDNIQFITIPIITAPTDPNRLAFQQPEADQVWRKVRKDKPLTKRLSTDVISAGDLPGKGESSSPSADPSSSPSGSPSSTPSSSAEDEASKQALADAGLCV